MHSFIRLGLLLLFATAGVAVAVGMATQQGPWLAVIELFAEAKVDDVGESTPAELSSRNKLPQTAADPASGANEPLEPTLADTTPPAALSAEATAPVFVQPNPRIAQDILAREKALQDAIDVSKSSVEANNRQLDLLEKTLPHLFDRNAVVAQTAADPEAEQPKSPLPPRPASPAASAGPKNAGHNTLTIDLEGDDRLNINIQDADIREVLKLLGEQSGLNILTTNNVTGNVSASMNGVDVASAMDAILRSNGYLAKREQDFVYVGTAEDFAAQRRLGEALATRVYRPNYATAAEIQSLVTPLLTPAIGSISVTSAAEVGIATDSSAAGGDKYSGLETIVIRDYKSVLDEVDAIVREVDQQPMQVAIEAMILSVKLSDQNKFGVNFAALLDNDKIRLVSGTPPASLASIDVKEGGLKFGFMDQDLSLFIDALETIGDANVIASPRLTCLNKQKAQILIGAQKGYVSTTVTETSTTQSVEFLEVGTQLRLRPFISSDGMIRMEVHPELSTGEVLLRGDFTLPEKEVTEVTTNIMCQDGRTIIIGGLIREELSTTASQIPLLGSIPYVGIAFRQKTEQIERREIIVLITPRIIYEPASGNQGDKAALEFHHHQAVYADSMSPIGKRALGLRYFRLAQLAWERGDCKAAMRWINKSIQIDPQRRAAIDLRSDIAAGIPQGDHTDPLPVPHPYQEPLDGEMIAPWLLDKLGSEAEVPSRPMHPVDSGTPGQIKQIAPAEPKE